MRQLAWGNKKQHKIVMGKLLRNKIFGRSEWRLELYSNGSQAVNWIGFKWLSRGVF
jgi:hypothetical protein